MDEITTTLMYSLRREIASGYSDDELMRVIMFIRSQIRQIQMFGIDILGIDHDAYSAILGTYDVKSIATQELKNKLRPFEDEWFYRHRN